MPSRWVGIFLSWHMGFMGRLPLGGFLNNRDDTIEAHVLIFTNDNGIVANGFGGEDLMI